MGSRYVIPFEGENLIYRPRRHLAFLGNDALVSYLEARGKGGAAVPAIESFLRTAQYDAPDRECTPAAIPEGGPKPTGAVLLMTNRCNLRCVYCYADAGEDPRPVEMTWSSAKAVLDFVAENAAESPDPSPPSLTFHGGGEPTVHWDLLARCVEYLEELAPGANVSMSSNGVWNPEQREFVCKHFTNVSLSMDGVPSVQDAQRPRPSGGPSFDAVRESMTAMDEAGIDYGVRMTVLPSSVDRLTDSVRNLCETSTAKSIQVEPTFTDVRGRYADISFGFADAFAAHFLDAWKVGREAGRQVYYSGARPWVIADRFCQAPLKAAVATADGRLVTCFEVFAEESPLAGSFTIGRVTGDRIEYDPVALQAFLDSEGQRRRECEDCFCYWHCCGDCATRRPGERSASEGRCRVTRSITLGMLLSFIEEGDGVWVGLRQNGDAGGRPPEACPTAPTPGRKSHGKRNGS